ncbi:MAG TPA: hypothetical protein VEG36_00500 [Burkholderiales bacterium]|nr:hypothetical protein [Burkholderiales bacterium]
MPFTVEARAAEALVYVTHRGKLTLDEARAAQDQAAALMRAQGLLGLLLDLRAAEAAERDSTLYIFELAVSAAERLPPGTRIAAVVRPGRPGAPLDRFAEDATSNRGLRLAWFTEHEPALAWLTQSA